MVSESIITDKHCYSFKRISWTAIVVGALIGVGLGFLLNLFGIAIGLSTTTVSTNGAMAVAIGGFIGILIGVIISMGIAGYAAGYLGRFYCPKRNLGILYGFTTWSLALLLSAVITTQISNYLSTYSHTITGTSLVISSQNQNEEVKTNNTSANPEVTKFMASPNSLAYGAFILFALFFVGAISSCLGACWAMTCRRDD